MADYLTSALNALKLPMSIIAGLFIGSSLLLVLQYFAFINLMEIHPLAWLAVIIAAVVSGSLSFVAVCGVIYDNWKQRHKITLLARRRELRRAEEKQERSEYEAQVLKRLDYLTKEELGYVANCLRKNEQSFSAYVYSGPVANLIMKGLVSSPGTTHHQDHYPFCFTDFVWAALLSRKGEFIAKDDANKTQNLQHELQRRGLARTRGDAA